MFGKSFVECFVYYIDNEGEVAEDLEGDAFMPDQSSDRIGEIIG